MRGRDPEELTLAERQRGADLLALTEMAPFRRFLADLLFRRCGLTEAKLLDPIGMAYAEGRRAVGQEIWSWLVNEKPSCLGSLLESWRQEQARDRRDADAIPAGANPAAESDPAAGDTAGPADGRTAFTARPWTG